TPLVPVLSTFFEVALPEPVVSPVPAEEPVSVEPAPVRESSEEEVLLRSSLFFVEPLFAPEPVPSPNFTVEPVSDESLPVRESLDEELLLISSLSCAEPLSELFLDSLI